MSKYSLFVNDEVYNANEKAIASGAFPFGSSGGPESATTQVLFTNVSQGEIKVATHGAGTAGKRLAQVMTLVGGFYEVASSSAYEILFTSDTETSIKKLSSGTDSSVIINIIV